MADHYKLFSVLILFLLMTVESLGDLLPCSISYLLKNNIITKHIFGFFTMLFFVILAEHDNELTLEKSISHSLVLYFWFILMTRTSKYFFIVLAILLGAAYLLSIKKRDILRDTKDKKEAHHQVLKIETYTDYIYKVFMTLTVLGMFIYMGEKKIEYKTKFNYKTFFLGNVECRHKSPSVSVVTALKNTLK